MGVVEGTSYTLLIVAGLAFAGERLSQPTCYVSVHVMIFGGVGSLAEVPVTFFFGAGMTALLAVHSSAPILQTLTGFAWPYQHLLETGVMPNADHMLSQ